MPTVLNQRTIRGAMPPGAVYIGRPSKWGNPYQIGRDGDRASVIKQFATYLAARPDLSDQARVELRGRDLVCWCAPLPCHGDVLLQVANGAD